MTEYQRGRQWTLALPYTVPPLSLNRRMHHMKEAGVKRQIMDDTHWLAIHAKLPKGLRRIHVELVWTPGTTKTRDTDNPTPTLKKVIDGLVRYGLVPDDNRDIVSSECVIADVVKGRGTVAAVIHEMLPIQAD